MATLQKLKTFIKVKKFITLKNSPRAQSNRNILLVTPLAAQPNISLPISFSRTCVIFHRHINDADCRHPLITGLLHQRTLQLGWATQDPHKIKLVNSPIEKKAIHITMEKILAADVCLSRESKLSSEMWYLVAEQPYTPTHMDSSNWRQELKTHCICIWNTQRINFKSSSSEFISQYISFQIRRK